MGQKISVYEAIKLLKQVRKRLLKDPDNEYWQHAEYCLWVPLHNLANRLRREQRMHKGRVA